MQLNSNNIIVFGVRRTGTSLMMEILSQLPNYSLEIDKNKFKDEKYKGLQDFYNEGEFTNGINEKNFLKYSLLENKIIKMMEQGLNRTPIKFINDMKLIVVMNRKWEDHSTSVVNLERINFDVEIISNEKVKKIVPESEYDNFFYNYYLYPSGLEYGLYMSDLVLNIKRKRIEDKILVINFNDLINDFEKVSNLFKKRGIDILSGKDLIKKDTTKYRNSNRDKCKEFKPGYFKFLDLIYKKLNENIIDNELLYEIQKWYPIIHDQVNLRAKRIKEKYNIIIK